MKMDAAADRALTVMLLHKPKKKSPLHGIVVRGAVVAGVVFLAVVSLLGVVWELSPTWRVHKALNNFGFPPLPASAKSVTHDYTGALGPFGLFKNDLRAVTEDISFEAAPADITDFIGKSSILRDRHTRKTADGYQGQIDDMTSFRLMVNDRGNKIRITIRDHYD